MPKSPEIHKVSLDSPRLKMIPWIFLKYTQHAPKSRFIKFQQKTKDSPKRFIKPFQRFLKFYQDSLEYQRFT